MRLIDADALIKKWENVHSKDIVFEMAIIGATNDVKKAPTIDAVPVIRCKDCKYWLPHAQFGFDADNDEYHNYCKRLVPDDDYYAYTREADDYCSRAERKEE